MWNLIRKDLLRRWRNPVATVVMIIFPLFMSGALGMVYSSGGGGSGFPRIKILIQNQDQEGFLANAIVGALGQEEGQEYLDVVSVGDEGPSMMEEGKASALVVLPEGFSRDVLAGRPTVIQVVRNPAEGIKPEIVVQGAQVLATYLDQGARLLGDELGQVDRMIAADQIPDAALVAVLAGRIVERIRGAEDYLFPPLVTIGSQKEQTPNGEQDTTNRIFGYILVMTTVMALMFVATRSVSDIYEERKTGMLRRQLATPLQPGFIIFAKITFGVVFGVIVMIILAGIGLLLGWISPPIDLLGAVVLTVAFSLAACGLLALVASLVDNEKLAGIVTWLLVMGMSALGGSMLPVSQMPTPMQAAAPFTVNYWAIDGFERLIFSAEGLPQILVNVGVLAAVGLVTGAMAQALLVRRFKGAGA